MYIKFKECRKYGRHNFTIPNILTLSAVRIYRVRKLLVGLMIAVFIYSNGWVVGTDQYSMCFQH